MLLCFGGRLAVLFWSPPGFQSRRTHDPLKTCPDLPSEVICGRFSSFFLSSTPYTPLCCLFTVSSCSNIVVLSQNGLCLLLPQGHRSHPFLRHGTLSLPCYFCQSPTHTSKPNPNISWEACILASHRQHERLLPVSSRYAVYVDIPSLNMGWPDESFVCAPWDR